MSDRDILVIDVGTTSLIAAGITVWHVCHIERIGSVFWETDF